MIGRRVRLGWILMLVLLTGCERRFFRPQGTVASAGGRLGQWDLAPRACARGLTVQVGAERVQSVATLLWEDQRLRGKKYRNHAYERAGDLPLRLDLVQGRMQDGGAGLVAVLGTMKSAGTRLDGSVCKRLRLETHEEGPALTEGKPTLGGTLEMDCAVDGNHLTADVKFNKCEW